MRHLVDCAKWRRRDPYGECHCYSLWTGAYRFRDICKEIVEAVYQSYYPGHELMSCGDNDHPCGMVLDMLNALGRADPTGGWGGRFVSHADMLADQATMPLDIAAREIVVAENLVWKSCREAVYTVDVRQEAWKVKSDAVLAVELVKP